MELRTLKNKKEWVTYLESETDSDSEPEFPGSYSESEFSESELLEVDGS